MIEIEQLVSYLMFMKANMYKIRGCYSCVLSVLILKG